MVAAHIAVMAGNYTLAKNIAQSRKTFITQAYDLVLLFLQKKNVFVLSVVNDDPILLQVGPKNGNF